MKHRGILLGLAGTVVGTTPVLAGGIVLPHPNMSLPRRTAEKLRPLAEAHAAAVPEEEAWKPVQPAGAGFRVLMPGPAQRLEKTLDNGPAKMRQQIYRVRRPDVEYAVTCIDVPAQAVEALGPEAFLNSLMTRMSKGKQVLARRKVKLGGLPAQETRYRTREGHTALLRAALQASRVVAIGVEGTDAAVSAPESARFLNSLAFGGASPVVTLSTKAPAGPSVKSAGAPRKPAPAPAAQGVSWARYRQASANFAIDAPGTVQLDREWVPVGRTKLRFHKAYVLKPDSAYQASWAELPAALVNGVHPRIVMDDVRNSVVDDLHGTLTKDETFVKNGNWGTEFRVAGPETSVLVRLYVVGNRVYRTSVKAPTDQSYNDDMVHFLNSFTLLKN
ncbi:MAG TPA: hypothetical protein VFU47_10030 [Armatimonadota bacterium]|nr:hypothetical protein [Armatimonadota bacterium]